MESLDINKDNFRAEVLETDKPVLLDFWASWCGPCRMIAPVLEELDQETADLTVCKVNVDENPDLADRFAIEAIPTLLFFKNGELVKKKMGLYPKDARLLILKEIRG